MPNRPSILVVDDEPVVRELLRTILASSYSVTVADDGAKALKLAQQNRPDLIVLDIHMPDMSGIQVCQDLRQNNGLDDVPIIMLTADGNVESRIEAFDMGADDFVSKPVHPQEFMARVSSKLRRASQSKKNKSFTFGNLVWDAKARVATIDGEAIELSVIETNLLLFFLRQPKVVLPRAEILSEVWKDTTVSQRTIDHHIMSLRKAIKNFDHTIATMYGVGYILKPKRGG